MDRVIGGGWPWVKYGGFRIDSSHYEVNKEGTTLKGRQRLISVYSGDIQSLRKESKIMGSRILS